eukprot:NODE_2741_length_1131_cov_29.162662_g2517_i0.p1 GENE.NODE_2741_length_1131_cov_29.162662_g2517_i0~~NODE_2741_length_1131_cov_29.162662_g2517_i0.p1  ORF type:complete len:291 (-),score=84.28 NODE_2741_length_1131_cov_29.162662_g2517_i0:92-964(-)
MYNRSSQRYRRNAKKEDADTQRVVVHATFVEPPKLLMMTITPNWTTFGLIRSALQLLKQSEVHLSSCDEYDYTLRFESPEDHVSGGGPPGKAADSKLPGMILEKSADLLAREYRMEVERAAVIAACELAREERERLEEEEEAQLEDEERRREQEEREREERRVERERLEEKRKRNVDEIERRRMMLELKQMAECKAKEKKRLLDLWRVRERAAQRPFRTHDSNPVKIPNTIDRVVANLDKAVHTAWRLEEDIVAAQQSRIHQAMEPLRQRLALSEARMGGGFTSTTSFPS